ncbi:MAG: hypothetical protein KJ592_03355 [Nanoarchaeota archaeon]|nr:hypothetical protein [Nanoarchaeota archaeon]
MENKKLGEKEITGKIKELKVELLKNPTKRARIKKEIARLLTMKQLEVGSRKSEVGKSRDSDADVGIKFKEAKQ